VIAPRPSPERRRCLHALRPPPAAAAAVPRAVASAGGAGGWLLRRRHGVRQPMQTDSAWGGSVSGQGYATIVTTYE
jgi:hypothetical protein